MNTIYNTATMAVICLAIGFVVFGDFMAFGLFGLIGFLMAKQGYDQYLINRRKKSAKAIGVEYIQEREFV